MPVLGIGGLFFRARDPEALSLWYRDNLGVGPASATDWYWDAQGGSTVFAPFANDTAYFATEKQWMLNLRVSDLDGLIADLRAKAVAVETRPDWDSPETGRFARIHDPEHNAIELWEPPED